ncbi:type I-E CRISPR-associated endonuclease Cas1 [Methanocella sp. CWC-04]|uniref:CRISPR-associated endonuclease Cas1 n=1 Tax=Methanooceanicella nereidis TaxID=2052831 RepID=A0AAP2RCH2_9EURY|nr:type I-E CRISPR-associated endonuclease Cas1e [Methanocella sp. CWC-04]MCD1294788.1 type I-E CRISPR-associated endonuclease Cas1 [Methanocella sp. CWC-04]
MPKDLHELPRVEDGWSYLYVEHCKIDRENKAVAIHDERGRTSVPCASLALLMMGPGTSITHEAVKTLADNGCLAAWCGEGGIRFYAQGFGETRHSSKLIRQALLVSNPSLRLKVVERMYRMRFNDQIPENLTIQQLRGMEGQRVRQTYALASMDTGVPWTGRNFDPNNWSNADPVNRALSVANSCLYGICSAAIISIGYSTGLGFIHTGKQLSFVYDIADLYKASITIPLSFRAAAADGDEGLERRVRLACRDKFNELNLLSRIVPDIERALDVKIPSDLIFDDFDSEQVVPSKVWDPKSGPLPGGVNYSNGN